MSKIKSIFLACCLSFLLSGCFGGEEIVYNDYEGDHFTMGVISTWQVIEKREFTEGVPEEAVVAFLSSDPTINMSVVRELLSVEALSNEYANANIVNAEKNVLNYEKVVVEDAIINEIETKFHIFKGKVTVSDLLLKYVQLYIVHDKVGYTITATLYIDSTDEEIEEIKNVMNTFKIKGAENETTE